MTPATILTFDGIEQPVSEWALDYGIPARLIVNRLNRGMSVEQAITKPMRTKAGNCLPDEPAYTGPASKRIGREPKLYTYGGESLSIKEWAKRLNVSYSAIQHRLKAGHPLEVALTAPRLPPVKSGRKYTHGGQSLRLREWAEQLGVTDAVLRYRLKSGMAYEVVFSPETPKPEGVALTFKGETHSIAEWARRTGLPRMTLFNRLRRLGWPAERALTTPVRPKRRPGVSSDFTSNSGTGAGSTLRPIPNISFEEKPE
jgi:hypothetical protein